VQLGLVGALALGFWGLIRVPRDDEHAHHHH
jgi:hypothetical protein